MAGTSADSTPDSVEPEVRLRAAIAGLPAYKAGKPAAPFDGTAYKLSSNENPYPPLPGVLKVAVAAAEEINRYPDFGSAALIEEIARFTGVSAERVAVGTGSVGVLQQLVQATAGPGDEVLFAWRSFEAYPIITQIAGASAVTVPLRADETHDLDAMADAVTERTRLVLVCNPNNPTGAIVRSEELERFLDRVPRDVLVVLDEAYIEFVRDEEYPDGVAVSLDRSNVCVLRTFSKAYGLAGIRCGYAVAEAEVIRDFEKIRNHYGVSRMAQIAGLEALADQDYLSSVVARVAAGRERISTIARQNDLKPLRSATNFVTIDCGRDGAFALKVMQNLLSRDVFIRKPMVPVLDRCIRVSVGLDHELDIFAEELPGALAAARGN